MTSKTEALEALKAIEATEVEAFLTIPLNYQLGLYFKQQFDTVRAYIEQQQGSETEALEALEALTNLAVTAKTYGHAGDPLRDADVVRAALEQQQELEKYVSPCPVCGERIGHAEGCRQDQPERQVPEVGAVIDEITSERHRQFNSEGFDNAHDDEHDLGELSMAAAAYATVASAQARGASADDFPADMMEMEGDWPWEPEAWKPKDARRNLVRAAALIVAEIERLDRAAAPDPEGKDITTRLTELEKDSHPPVDWYGLFTRVESRIDAISRRLERLENDAAAPESGDD